MKVSCPRGSWPCTLRILMKVKSKRWETTGAWCASAVPRKEISATGSRPRPNSSGAGARLCVGVDSHACENAFEEVRAVELDERSRLEKRHAAAEAPVLLDAATRLGYAACGLDELWRDDHVHLDSDDPSIAAMDPDHAPDAILFGATPRAVKSVSVAGKQIVAEGRHAEYDETLDLYRRSLKYMELI